MEKWVKRPYVSINEKNLQNLGLKGKVKSNYTKWLFYHFKKTF